MSDLRTLVIGLGETGRAVMQWCLSLGEFVRACDTRTTVLLPDVSAEEQARLELCCGNDFLDEQGQFLLTLLEGIDRLVVSPGLSPNQAPVMALLEEARRQELPVLTEIDLFAVALLALERTQNYRPKVLAITGTNGKTTVTSLVCHLLQGAGVKAAVAGNISPAVLQALTSFQLQNALPDVWVLELSSFQLELTSLLKPDASVVLNISQDHLDWHGNLAAYVAAKAKLLKASTLAVVNRDDEQVVKMVERIDDENIRSFGMSVPVLSGDLGLDNDGSMLWLVESRAPSTDDLQVKRKKAVSLFRDDGLLNRLMPAEALQIKGTHNLMNAQAALILARSLGLSHASLLHSLRQYRGEPHRVELVRVIQDVSYIDDSKGTNVGATLAAINGLGCQVVLIAGGVGKGQDFSPLKEAIVEHARAVVLIGESAPEIQSQIQNNQVPIQRVDSLEQAVQVASEYARAGDAVLLSPACASFDMFKDYLHRSNVFVAAVDELALSKGDIV